jgi:uncharacterized protein
MKRFITATVLALFASMVTIWMLSDGEQTPEKRQRAEDIAHFEHVKQRAEKGQLKAQYALGLLYRDGRGVKKDLAAAVRLFSKTAKRGHAVAQYTLGKMYETGDGLRTDLDKAIMWHNRSAGLGGYALAQFALGQIYFSGTARSKDYALAAEWFLKAARQGYGPAQFLIGVMFEEGWAVERDYVESYKWLTLSIPKARAIKAIDKKYNPTKARKRLVAKMNSSQITRGEGRAKEWKPKVRR